MLVENSAVEDYLDNWSNHIAGRGDSVRGLLILPNKQMVWNLATKDSCIKALNGSRLYIKSADEIEREKAGRFVGFSFERIYIIDTGTLSDITLGILRARLRSPINADCKMYINGKA